MTDDTNPHRIDEALGGLLALENIREQCPGMARATQMLRISTEVICTDEVLVEEAHYESMDQMGAEITSLTIKMGMFSPFERRSTYPPKYFFAGEHTPVAYFVTSVPHVSLDTVLESMNRKYPPHYTWDRIGFIRDRIHTLLAALRESWAHTRNPMRIVTETTQAVLTRQPQTITRHERMQLAAFLAVSVQQKHRAGIFHNNINSHTVFFPDALSPRLLNNYSGVTPLYAPQYTPSAILDRMRGDSPFSEQSADVHSLALLAYRLITGESLDGRDFRLEDPADLPHPPVVASIAHRTGWKKVFNAVIDLVNEAQGQWVQSREWVRAILDRTKWPRLKKLCRASGPLIYSLPCIGPILCVCIPPRTAVVLRAILDRECNDAMFGTHAHVVRATGGRRNAECPFLLSGLSGEWFHRSSEIARLIQECLDKVKQRPVETADDDRTAPAPLLSARLKPALRWTAAMLLLCTTFLLYDSDHLRPMYGITAEAGGKGYRQHNVKSPASNTRRKAVTTKTTDRARIAGKLTSRRNAAKDRQVIPVQRRVADRLSAREQQTRKDLAREREKQPCKASLVAVPGYRKVLRITDMTQECRAGDLKVGTEEILTLLQLAKAESRWFVIRPREHSLGEIITVRLCRYPDESHVEGRFYEAIGTQGMGREIPVENGDLFAFSWLVLNRYRNTR